MASNKINLLFAVHCHQPVGNFDGVFEEAYNKAYLPFIQALERHPKIKMALHYSGCLLDWLNKKRPEFLPALKKLVKSGQVEMMGGGYYEPILPLIPDRDKLGQLRMHSDFIKQYAGCQPEGAWLTERVWEQSLAKIFKQGKLSYTIVDDSHFERAGKDVEEILGYYLTEEEGLSIAIFPSSKKLRYAMPFRMPHETIDYLRSVATPDGKKAVMYGDDGEKFGLWPKTYKWVYEEGWLERLFKALEDNSDWITIQLPREYLENYEPLGRIYLPSSSYPEMLEWSGGYFRNFLVKYPEANWMHKRMLYVSEKLDSVKTKPDKYKSAKTALYKSQCNCAYWHGVFGGLYLHHLRHAVYSNLIEAQNLMNGAGKPKNRIAKEIADIDKDGFDEIIMTNGPLGVYISPRRGGTITEIDYMPKSINLVNTLARRPEEYHKKINSSPATEIRDISDPDGIASIHDITGAKEKSLGELLNYDRHGKSFLIEHFLAPEADAEDFARSSFAELGDFAVSAYKYALAEGPSKITAHLEREGTVLSPNRPTSLKVEKSVTLESGKTAVGISYRLKNTADSKTDVWFGTEFNLSLRDKGFSKIGGLRDINKLEIKDEWFGTFLKYSLSKAADLWFYPVETVSESEGGLERTYQQLCLLFHWRIPLSPKQTWTADISLDIK